MKKILFLLLTISVFSSCLQTRYVTEQYIKTNKQNHIPGDFSEIKLYSIYQGFTKSSPRSYIELTGYKYENEKKLVIATDRYYKARKKYSGDNTVIVDIDFIDLDVEQCKDIVKNFKILQGKLRKSKPKMNETIYQDYTVTDDLYISFSKTKLNKNPIEISLWIKDEKFTIPTDLIIERIEKFIEY